jgi:hypothetical protein
MCLFVLGSNLLFGQRLISHDHAVDTLPKSDTIRLSLYLKPVSLRSLGNFAVVANDKHARQTNAGFSVLNTLRGHMPNFEPGAMYSNQPGELRFAYPLMVIDGLPFSNRSFDYYNLNTFEFENLYALSSGNAVSMYGTGASRGAFILETKNGRDVLDPTLEFNSTPSLSWEKLESDPIFQVEERTIQQWRFTNAIAFMQDFGKVDTRVSYTNSFLPNDAFGRDTRRDNHAFKVNTGVDLLRGLDVRLILDHFSSRDRSTDLLGTTNLSNKTLQGNLILTYKVLSWLTLNSQTALAQLDKNGTSSATETNAEQKRKLGNLFISFKKSFGSSVTYTAFSGIQYENNGIAKSVSTTSGIAGSERKYVTKTLSMGMGMQYINALFVDFNYRQDDFNMLPDGNSKPNWSVSSAFNFLDAFNWESRIVPAAKLRASFGITSVPYSQGFPYSLEDSYWTTFGVNHPKTNMLETGIDLSLLMDRLTLSGTYFYIDEKAPALIASPGNSGYDQTFIGVGAVKQKGLEAILTGTPIKRTNISLLTKLIWGSYEIHVKQPGGYDPSIEPIFLGYHYPDWRGGILNQLELKRFFTTFLIDARKGGNVLQYDYSSADGSLTVQDGTQVKLRDVSLGYSLPIRKTNMVQVALSFRNIWLIYSKANQDVEESAMNLQKSANISLSLNL